ncbi:MAG: serine/threonine-protein phosphatase [Actinobacteria bacterium]|nr:serine/threonine-protein phosphatase [Actinomycetota bacterium]MCB8996993.1 serine/threonine-protein phosphatase [Actinomycetota bacterium]MCB9414016.1 serine/threonine-protein phosphatase [Actinomycetota bacterium]MCB9424525.1 serine/threonine-protein phosphatase [Actinomycetota bacterium]HRY08631.1 protein phosphatase 2C domain-containing protein [Candidatus Nanopelagicales bacterium]
MPLVFRYAARSDVGLVRQGNEDSGYASDNLLIVADGMGGHVAGEMASATVTAILAGLPIAESEDVLTQLADAVDEAQLEMRHIIAEQPDFQGMGTTVTVVCWQGDRASLAHVGDSRAYMLRGGELLRLTKDHTYVQTLVDAGQITEEEAATHRRRNLLIRAIDGVNTVEPDLSIREVHAGDRIMLCTDGLSGVLRDDQIRDLLSRSDPPGAVTALVEAAIERGAPDNVTCVVADVAQVDDPPAGNRPVVVGAAAEPRTRSKLPGVDFPQDSQPTDAPPETTWVPEAVPPRSRRSRWIAAGVAAFVIVGLIGGAWLWIAGQYYVGNRDGYVAVYQGVPQNLGSIPLSSVVETTAIPSVQLPVYAQELVNATIAADSRDDANRIVAILDEQAATCRSKPKTEGCPGATSAPTPTPSPTATP